MGARVPNPSIRAHMVHGRRREPDRVRDPSPRMSEPDAVELSGRPSASPATGEESGPAPGRGGGPEMRRLAESEAGRRAKVSGLAALLARDLTLRLRTPGLKLSAAQRAWREAWQPLLSRGLADTAVILDQRWLSPAQGSELELGLSYGSGPWCPHNIIIGPAADPNSAPAQAFTALWGREHCQLRRFEDGAIQESVELHNPWGPAYRPAAVVRHLMRVHHRQLQLTVEVVHCPPALLPRSFQTHADVRRVRGAMERLAQWLMSRSEASLPVRRVRGLAACLHYGGDQANYRVPALGPVQALHPTQSHYELSVAAALAPAAARAIPVRLDITHRQRMSAELFEPLRLAYLLHLRQSLTAAHIPSLVRERQLYLIREGYLFALDVEPPTSGPDQADAASEEPVLSVHGWLQLVGLRYPAWAGTVHLVKRWISAQMLDSVLPPAMVEVLVAEVFVNPLAGLAAPMTVEAGLVRFFDLLAFRDWRTQPIVLNDHDLIPTGQIEAVRRAMLSRRDTLPYIVIITPRERGVSALSASVPPYIARRLVNLARLSLAQLVGAGTLDLAPLAQVLGASDLGIYDALIHLRPMQIPLDQAKIQSPAGWKPCTAALFPIVDYDPVERYLDELRNSYGSVADFFYGHGRPVIGVKLAAEALDQTPVEGTKNVAGKFILQGQLVHNIEAMIEDFSDLGTGLVKHVETNLRS